MLHSERYISFWLYFAKVEVTEAIGVIGKNRGPLSRRMTMLVDLPRIIVPKRYDDDRGWFSETFHEQRLHAVGITCRFVQDNQSNSKRAGTLRGLHFQRPPAAQAKLVTVVKGRITDVAVDIRRGSPTFGKHVSMEISAESGRQMFIPVGFAHGFVALEDDTVVMSKSPTITRQCMIVGFVGMTRTLQFHGHSRTPISSPRKKIGDFRCSRNAPARFPMMAIRSRR